MMSNLKICDKPQITLNKCLYFFIVCTVIPLDDCYFGTMMAKVPSNNLEHSDDFLMGFVSPSYKVIQGLVKKNKI